MNDFGKEKSRRLEERTPARGWRVRGLNLYHVGFSGCGLNQPEARGTHTSQRLACAEGEMILNVRKRQPLAGVVF